MEAKHGDQKECPRCAEMVKVRAKIFRLCTHEFEEQEVQAEIIAPEKPEKPILLTTNSPARYSDTMDAGVGYGVYGLLGVLMIVVVFSLIQANQDDWLRDSSVQNKQSLDKSNKPKKRYTLGGEEIQENGLTVSQQMEIINHCNESPNAWDGQ